MIIAATQTKPSDGNIEANIADHLHYIGLAAKHGVQLIVFPEMSLTGYERELAGQLAFTVEDPRLNVLKEMAVLHNMVIIAGAPVAIGQQLHIGAFAFLPDNTTTLYTKQFLHPGEEIAFTPNSNFDSVIHLGDEKISLAICADITQPVHAANAAKNRTTLYVASLFYTPGGIAEAYQQLGGYAQKHSMNILMANYSGVSYGLPSAGQSAFWDKQGTLMGAAGNEDACLLIVDNNMGYWKAQVLAVA